MILDTVYSIFTEESSKLLKYNLEYYDYKDGLIDIYAFDTFYSSENAFELSDCVYIALKRLSIYGDKIQTLRDFDKTVKIGTKIDISKYLNDKSTFTTKAYGKDYIINVITYFYLLHKGCKIEKLEPIFCNTNVMNIFAIDVILQKYHFSLFEKLNDKFKKESIKFFEESESISKSIKEFGMSRIDEIAFDKRYYDKNFVCSPNNIQNILDNENLDFNSFINHNSRYVLYHPNVDIIIYRVINKKNNNKIYTKNYKGHILKFDLYEIFDVINRRSCFEINLGISNYKDLIELSIEDFLEIPDVSKHLTEFFDVKLSRLSKESFDKMDFLHETPSIKIISNPLELSDVGYEFDNCINDSYIYKSMVENIEIGNSRIAKFSLPECDPVLVEFGITQSGIFLVQAHRKKNKRPSEYELEYINRYIKTVNNFMISK